MKLDFWTVVVCSAVLIVFLAGFWLGSLSNNEHMDVNNTCIRSENSSGWWCLLKDEPVREGK